MPRLIWRRNVTTLSAPTKGRIYLDSYPRSAKVRALRLGMRVEPGGLNPLARSSLNKEDWMSQLTSKAEAALCCIQVASIFALAFVYFSIPHITGYQALGIAFVWIALFVAIVIVRTAQRI